jgi:hypothetical protein
MYLQVERDEKADDREWEVKMALLSADPARYGPVIFPESKPKEEEVVVEELQPGDLTVGGFHPDITVKYANVPTPEEVEEVLAEFPEDLVLGIDDFHQFSRDARLTNGRRH